MALYADLHTLTGDFRRHQRFRSRFLAPARDLLVYLPPGYSADPRRRFPVLYMHDGQNLFDRATAFHGEEWSVDETAHELITAGKVDPLIIVGVSNTGAHRIDEYTPTRDRARRAGGQADLYGRMLVEEVKPFIDARYRTLPDAANTGLGGSSLGGLVSLYFGLVYPDVFRKLAVISPSIYWDNSYIIRQVRSLPSKLPLRIFLSMGTSEAPKCELGARLLRDALVAKGWRAGVDLRYVEIEGAAHNERAWAAVVASMLRYLLPPKPRLRGRDADARGGPDTARQSASPTRKPGR